MTDSNKFVIKLELLNTQIKKEERQMKKGEVFFYRVEETLPPVVLEELNFEIDDYNAKYLAGKACKPNHKIVEFTSREHAKASSLTKSETDEIIGDITHQVETDDIIIICSDDIEWAEKTAEKLGYRPAQAGEFLQLLQWLKKRGEKYFGWFYCYKGKKPKYAILAGYSTTGINITFDTFVGKGYTGANQDNYFLFVGHA